MLPIYLTPLLEPYSWINIPSIYYIINSTPVCYWQSTADNCKASS